jgi:hypothetical protein
MLGASKPAEGFERLFRADDFQIKNLLETEKVRQTVSFRAIPAVDIFDKLQIDYRITS